MELSSPFAFFYIWIMLDCSLALSEFPAKDNDKVQCCITVTSRYLNPNSCIYPKYEDRHYFKLRFCVNENKHITQSVIYRILEEKFPTLVREEKLGYFLSNPHIVSLEESDLVFIRMML